MIFKVSLLVLVAFIQSAIVLSEEQQQDLAAKEFAPQDMAEPDIKLEPRFLEEALRVGEGVLQETMKLGSAEVNQTVKELKKLGMKELQSAEVNQTVKELKKLGMKELQSVNNKTTTTNTTTT